MVKKHQHCDFIVPDMKKFTVKQHGKPETFPSSMLSTKSNVLVRLRWFSNKDNDIIKNQTRLLNLLTGEDLYLDKD